MDEGQTPADIARSLSEAQRRVLTHREGGSEACMSWATARVLHGSGLMPRETRYLKLTPLGLAARAAILGEGG